MVGRDQALVKKLDRIVECIPNFSEGSKVEVIKAILGELKSVDGAYLLDSTFDDYYNRLVATVAGEPEAVFEAVLRASGRAIELIDMNHHKGQHPRIGAVDVVPFIPIRNMDIKDCINLAHRFARALSEKFEVPVYLYGEAATRPERRDLDWIRKGEYERLNEMMMLEGREPDYGPRRPHPTAGATIVGARRIMVGLNVNLNTGDMKIARKIAKAVHSKSGGFAYVKAMAAKLPDGRTQIGMSIYNFEKTPFTRIIEFIRMEAERYNVSIVDAEFCGLIPLRALFDALNYYTPIINLNENRILEIVLSKATGRIQL